MHFKKDDGKIGNIQVRVGEDHKVKFTLDDVAHEKPSKVRGLVKGNGSSLMR
jgi:hypothetical protein